MRRRVLEVARLRRVAGNRLRIHLDLTVRGALPTGPMSAEICEGTTSLARLVSPLVIEPDGRCVPLEYGFPDTFALGNVSQHPLRVLAATWRDTRLPRFQQLLADVHSRLTADDAPMVADWYAETTRAATAVEILAAG